MTPLPAGSTGSTPTLYPGDGTAAQEVPPVQASASPKQLGRPRSASKDLVSHPLKLSERSCEDADALREPLGHSLEAGALYQVCISLLEPASRQGC